MAIVTNNPELERAGESGNHRPAPLSKPCESRSPIGNQCQKERGHEGCCHANDGKHSEDWSRCDMSDDCELHFNHYQEYKLRHPDSSASGTDGQVRPPTVGDSTVHSSGCPGVVLGLDRNGREVRRGDRVRCYDNPSFELIAGTLSPESPFDEACFHDIDGGRHILQKAADLVDEKAGQAEQCPASYANIQCEREPGHDGPHGFKDRNAPKGRWDWVSQGEPAYEGASAALVISELCRALAQPTMGERFERFKADIGAILADFPTITAQYDMGTAVFDDKPAPFVIMRCEAMGWSGTAWCYQDVLEFLSGLKLEIGEEVLFGRAILRGGK